MSEQKAEYNTENDLKDALDMIGKGYPSFKIELPRKELVGDFGGIEEREKPAYIKYSTAFKARLKEISGTALKVWIYIALSVNYDGLAFPGIRTVAKYIGMSHQSVLTAITELESLGLLSVTRGTRKFNIYSVSNDYVTIGKGKEPFKKLDSSEAMSQKIRPMSQINTPDESSGLDLNKKEQEVNKNNNENKKDLVDAYIDYNLSKGMEEIENTINALEKGLKRNIPRTGVWQDLAKWINKQPVPVLKWINWYMSDDFRSVNSWRMKPDDIRNSFPQVTPDPPKPQPKPQPKPIEPEPKYVNLVEYEKKRKQEGK